MGGADAMAAAGIKLDALEFAYPGCPPFIDGANLELPRGSRCLLIGANGAGKTTLLQIVAGKYMVEPRMVSVLGRPPFHDMVRAVHQGLLVGSGRDRGVHGLSISAFVWLQATTALPLTHNHSRHVCRRR